MNPQRKKVKTRGDDDSADLCEVSRKAHSERDVVTSKDSELTEKQREFWTPNSREQPLYLLFREAYAEVEAERVASSKSNVARRKAEERREFWTPNPGERPLYLVFREAQAEVEAERDAARKEMVRDCNRDRSSTKNKREDSV